MVLKPAEQSPLSAIRLGELALEAGLPEGVLNVVPGFGETAGKAIGLHPDVDAIAFTGSTEVGKLFLTYSGQSNMKKVWLECGGKTPNIVMADCPDIDVAIASAVEGVFFNQGEMCTSASRLLVDRRIKDRVVEGLARHTAAWAPGDPLNPASANGSLVSRGHMDMVLGYIASARDEGASVIAGGGQTLKDTGGAFVEPTLLNNVTPGMRVAREEIFGPVLSIIEFDGEDEAIRVANGTIYGLGAAVWTSNISTAHRMARRVRAGIVYVNCFDADDITTPFGGYKQSGNGRDKSLHAIDKYVETKTIWIRPMIDAHSRTTAEWKALDSAHFLHPFTDHKALHQETARIITRAKGLHIWDSTAPVFWTAWRASGAPPSVTAAANWRRLHPRR